MATTRKKKSARAPIDIDALEVPEQEEAATTEVVADVLTLEDQDERLLAKQAQFLNIPVEQIGQYTPEHRCLMLDYKIRSLILDALDAGDKKPVEYATRRMNDFPGQTLMTSAQIRARIQKWKGKEKRLKEDPGYLPRKDEEDFIPSVEQQVAPNGEEVTVYMEGGDEEIPVSNKRRRDGVTVGIIEETERPQVPDDLVGDKPPKNLADLYARWPMIGNANYYIRIERTKPKTYNGVNCAGLVGEIRGRRITEAEIQQTYGGSEYKLTLYGPDPRHVADQDGELKLKALTEPFTLFVPVHPPNLNALPGTENIMNGIPNPSQPFGPQGPVGPKGPSDAVIHKTDITHQQWMLEREDKMNKEKQELEARQSQLANEQVTTMLGAILNNSSEQLKHEREEARRREEKHEKEVEAERKARESKEAAIAEAKEQSQSSLLSFMERMGPDREGEIRRLVESHRLQMDTVQKAFEEQIKTMRDRHDGDLRRADERHRDTEGQYRLLLEQERSAHQKMIDTERQSWAQRERDLRDQAERDKTAMKDQFQSRLEDLKTQKDAEIKTLERMQSQMMNITKESFETKLNVSDTTHGLMLQHVQERLEDARQDADRARQEAEEAKDITTVMERARAQAEALGYEKKDSNDPKDWKERAVMMLGGAATSLFSKADEWMPKVMEQRQQQQMAQLAAAQQHQHQQEQAARAAARRAAQQQARQASAPQGSPGGAPRRTRGAQWASEGQEAPRPARTEEQPLGFQAAPESSEAAVKPNPNQEPAEQSVVTTSGSEVSENPPVESSNSNGAAASPFPKKFVDHFGEEGILSFLGQVENHINGQTDPGTFAQLFAVQYSEYARRLVDNFKPDEVFEALNQIPGAEMSPILTVAGKKWLKSVWAGIPTHLPAAAAQTTP